MVYGKRDRFVTVCSQIQACVVFRCSTTHTNRLTDGSRLGRTDPAAEEHTGLTDPAHTDLAVTFTVHKRLFVELDGSFVAALAAAVFGDFGADLCGELLLCGHRVRLLHLNAL